MKSVPSSSEREWLPFRRQLLGDDAATNDDRRSATRIAFGPMPGRAELSELFDVGEALMEAGDPLAVLAGALLHRVITERDRLDLLAHRACYHGLTDGGDDLTWCMERAGERRPDAWPD